MTPVEISKLLASLKDIAVVFDALGIPGIVSLVLIGPFIVFAIMLFLEHKRSKQLDSIIETHRKEINVLVEAYRADTQKVLKEMDSKHSDVSGYYKNNVELLKTTQQLASDLSETVAYNSRILERVVSLAENNMFCPMAREKARGTR